MESVELVGLPRSARVFRQTLPFYQTIRSLMNSAPRVLLFLALLAVTCLADETIAAPLGLGPLAASPDGSRIFVAEVDGRRIDAVDLGRREIVGSLPLSTSPTGLAIDRRGTLLYATCAGPRGAVHAIDTASMKVAFTMTAGHTPIGPTIHPDGRRLYVCNRFDNTVSVLDLERRVEVACVPALREPCAAVITPDGKWLFVLNHLPAGRADRDNVAAAITVIDTATNRASRVSLRKGSTGLRGACLSMDGARLYVTHTTGRYDFPATHVDRGWMNVNALSIIDTRTRSVTATILLDDPDRGAANPWAVACAAVGHGATEREVICVTHAGTHEMSVIDTAGLLTKLAQARSASGYPGKASLYAVAPAPDMPDDVLEFYARLANPEVADDLTFLSGIRQRITLEGDGPRGIVVVGSRAYVAQYFSDSLAVVEVRAGNAARVAGTIPVGPRPQPTPERRGEMLFHDGRICFQQWQSCATCHPDGRIDGLNWDLTNDGLGNPKNTKSLLLAHATPPAMWTGARASAEEAVRAGIRHVQFAEVSEEDAASIDAYLRSLRPEPSPHLVQSRFSESALRGRELFFAKEVACAECHRPPLYTDLRSHDVGSGGPFDRRSDFDTPSLNECWRTAPYLHDGRAATMTDVLTTFNSRDRHGKTSNLTKQALDDLAEYLLSL